MRRYNPILLKPIDKANQLKHNAKKENRCCFNLYVTTKHNFHIVEEGIRKESMLILAEDKRYISDYFKCVHS